MKINGKYTVKKFIRACLEEALDKESGNKPLYSGLTPEGVQYVDTNLKAFSDSMKRLAVENKNPCIKSYLMSAIVEFEKDASLGNFQILGSDELMLIF